jgi:hypothetical protein
MGIGHWAMVSQRGLLPKGEASAKGVSPMSDWRTPKGAILLRGKETHGKKEEIFLPLFPVLPAPHSPVPSP